METNLKKLLFTLVLSVFAAGCADLGAGKYENYRGTLNERGMRRCRYWDECGSGWGRRQAEKAPAQDTARSEPAVKAPVAAAAKTQGSAEGKVTSADGSPLSASLAFEQNGKTVRNVSARDAAYSEELPEGNYHVRAAAKDHEPQVKDVKVAAGKKTVTDFTLLPSSKALARVEGNRIVILQPVYFATSKADILAKSYDLLNDVARVLVDNPQITKVEVAGHTDTVGDAAANQRLSAARADSVKAYLVQKGVAGGRLSPVGYGEERPVVTPDDTPDKQAQNRRVEFLVLEPAQN